MESFHWTGHCLHSRCYQKQHHVYVNSGLGLTIFVSFQAIGNNWHPLSLIRQVWIRHMFRIIIVIFIWIFHRSFKLTPLANSMCWSTKILSWIEGRRFTIFCQCSTDIDRVQHTLNPMILALSMYPEYWHYSNHCLNPISKKSRTMINCVWDNEKLEDAWTIQLLGCYRWRLEGC